MDAGGARRAAPARRRAELGTVAAALAFLYHRAVSPTSPPMIDVATAAAERLALGLARVQIADPAVEECMCGSVLASARAEVRPHI